MKALPAEVGGSGSEWLARYETVRSQILEGKSSASDLGLERAFIERQGLAAWIAAGPTPSSPRSVGESWPSMPQAQSAAGDLVLALAELVVGDLQEAHDDREP